MSSRQRLTFSIPKNLSLPSGRSAPAFRSIFSRGVNSGAASSFFLRASFPEGFEDFCNHVSLRASETSLFGLFIKMEGGGVKAQKRTAEPGFHLLRKLAMMALSTVSRDEKQGRGRSAPASRRRTARESAEVTGIDSSRHPKRYSFFSLA